MTEPVTDSVSFDTCAARIGAGDGEPPALMLPARSVSFATTARVPSRIVDRSSLVVHRPLGSTVSGVPWTRIAPPPLDLRVSVTAEPGSPVPEIVTDGACAGPILRGIVTVGAAGAVPSTAKTNGCPLAGTVMTWL